MNASYMVSDLRSDKTATVFIARVLPSDTDNVGDCSPFASLSECLNTSSERSSPTTKQYRFVKYQQILNIHYTYLFVDDKSVGVVLA